MTDAKRYFVPAGRARREFTERGSRFIGTAGPAASIEEAMTFIEEVKSEFSDATHNVWAYLVGYGSSAEYACHNDGEPGGTAGPPALSVLQNSGLGDVAVVVTRYFGGIKLGSGGLVRAYSRAACEAVEALPRKEKVRRRSVSVQVGYRHFDAIQRLLPKLDVLLEEVNLGVEVVFHLAVPEDMMEVFQHQVMDATAGTAHITLSPVMPA